jgi:hypothetical protein
MQINFTNSLFSMALIASLAMLTTGCGQQASDTRSSQVADTSHESHDHDGWWCVEHGIPEEECSMCRKKAADEFKAKGDWCEEHNRAESQCFQCDPTRADKFAKLYEAKFGHAPPEPAE